jgi:hypothetical protein
VFENFRHFAHDTYGLDPLHNYTMPGFSWDALFASKFDGEKPVLNSQVILISTLHLRNHYVVVFVLLLIVISNQTLI